MEKISLRNAIELERYINLGPGSAADARKKARQWLTEHDAGAVQFEDGVREVLVRIMADPASRTA